MTSVQTEISLQLLDDLLTIFKGLDMQALCSFKQQDIPISNDALTLVFSLCSLPQVFGSISPGHLSLFSPSDSHRNVPS